MGDESPKHALKRVAVNTFAAMCSTSTDVSVLSFLYNGGQESHEERVALWFRGGFFGAVLLKNPAMREIEDFGRDEQIVAAEVVGFFPEVAIAEETRQRHVVALAGFRQIVPDARLDQAEANLVDGFVVHGKFLV